MRGKHHYEKNISTEQRQARPNPRVFKTDVDKAGKENYQSKTSEGKKTASRITSCYNKKIVPIGMIW
jgi:hypothetical protein